MELTDEAIDEIERRLENPTAGATYETPELRMAPRVPPIRTFKFNALVAFQGHSTPRW